MTKHDLANLSNAKELAAWPDFWVLRGGSTVTGHALYGLAMPAGRLVWTLSDVAPPEGLGWSYKRIPLLAQTDDLAVAATYVGRNRERAWLLALEPRSGALLDIAQLARFQQAFSDCDRVEKLGDLDPRDFFARAAQAFGWTLEQFQGNLDDTRLEFLYHYARDQEDVLATMIEEGERT
jgi:hypothetical protein